MKTTVFVSILSASVLGSCLSQKQYTERGWARIEDWDRNGSGAVEQFEFVEGYLKDDFFSRWSPKDKPISYSWLTEAMFDEIDSDGNDVLDTLELNSKTMEFYFPHLEADPQHKVSLGTNVALADFREFNTENKVAGSFDSDSDRKITSLEMAKAMFQLADRNEDQVIKTIEFYHWLIYR